MCCWSFRGGLRPLFTDPSRIFQGLLGMFASILLSRSPLRAYAMTASAVDTTDALATLHAQMEDMMRRGSTRVAFALASPGNRASTARGGYDQQAFDRMVRSPTYAPLLQEGQYEVLKHRQSGRTFSALVRLTLAGGRSMSYEFGMSLQPAAVVDEHEALAPHQLWRGHPPQWRTDSVVPYR